MKTLLAQLRRHAPHAAEQLLNAQTEREVRDVICQLFDLTSVPTDAHDATVTPKNLPLHIAQYIDLNLPKGLTLKTLAQFLGYSEKYCSDFFQSTMGESFSSYLKHRRLERATLLLAATEKSMAEIAAALGFSDQFAFSHFFKRATGQSPVHFRLQHSQHQHRSPLLLPEGSR
ncbi:MAG: AraC family transcriptional regulator [Nitrospirota bacterium]|nr:AraC family transcriptional regulator [Nitrospirota bacterium]